jgi:hypothetical protein
VSLYLQVVLIACLLITAHPVTRVIVTEEIDIIELRDFVAEEIHVSEIRSIPMRENDKQFEKFLIALVVE